jgi:hypothetical protein
MSRVTGGSEVALEYREMELMAAGGIAPSITKGFM